MSNFNFKGFKFDDNYFKDFKRPGMKGNKPHIISLIITLIIWGILDYMFIPPYNIRSQSTWVFMLMILIIFLVLDTLLSLRFTKVNKYGAAICLVLILAFAVLTVSSAEIFWTKAYRDQIYISEVTNFSDEFDTISVDNIPVVDLATAIRLGEKQIGNQPGLGSQYNVSETYTFISTGEDLLRVSPLEYQDMYKWFINNSDGIPGYVKVNVRDSSDVELVMLEDGIKYSPSAYFQQNLLRHVRQTYRTDILSEYSFELDDEGNEYWVVSIIAPEIGWFGGLDAQGVIIVDPYTGEMNRYMGEKIPEWVDRVQPTSLAWSQIDNWGYYVHGFFNTLFGQKDMLQTTDGYNYVNIDTDTYIFSGLTSVGSDQSISGFALINLRTKEASYIVVGGANEYSAMSSAEGQVQHLGYMATFPTLLNISGQATYFISLKDYEGLVKMYSFVNVSDYSIVGVGDSVEIAYSDYLAKLLSSNKIDEIEDITEMDNISGTVTSINHAIIEGNSTYYITLDNSDYLFVLSVGISNELPLTNVNDFVEIEYITVDGNTVIANNFDNLALDY